MAIYSKHKNGMSDELYDYLSSKIKGKSESDYVFINPRTNRQYSNTAFSREWNDLKEKAGIKTPLRFHDLRHTVGTRLALANTPVPVIKEILAHSDIKTTMRYVHNNTSVIDNAVNVLSSYNKDLIQ